MFSFALSIITGFLSQVVISTLSSQVVANNIEEYPIAHPTSKILCGFCIFKRTFNKSDTSLWTIGTLFSSANTSSSFKRPSASFKVCLI